MKKLCVTFGVLFISFFLFSVSSSFATNAVTIAKPANGSSIHGPVTVCMAVSGVEVEPAKNGVNAGKGHHHLLIDTALPTDLSHAIGKDAHHVHMGDGSVCKTLKLSSGKHSISALFAQGNHVPYDPALSDTIEITVE